MPDFWFNTMVQCDTAEQAREVMAARMGHDEELGFNYLVDYLGPNNPRFYCRHCHEPIGDDDGTWVHDEPDVGIHGSSWCRDDGSEVHGGLDDQAEPDDETLAILAMVANLEALEEGHAQHPQG